MRKRIISFKKTGEDINIDTTIPSGKMIFSIFGAFTEFERKLIHERTLAELKTARARGRKGDKKFQLIKTQVRLTQVTMQKRDASIRELYKELGITRPTLYRYVSPVGELRKFGDRVLEN